MIGSLGRHEGDVHWGLRCWKGLAWVVQFLIRGPVQGWAGGPDGLRPEPYTNRVESQGFMGGVMRNPASSCPLKGRVCPHPPHPHTPTLHTKRHTKEKFSEKSDSCLHPHIVHRQPPMTPWRDGWTMGWVGAWTVGTVTGWGSGQTMKTPYLTTYPEKGTIGHQMRNGEGNGACGGKGRTSDKRNLFM